MNNYKEAIENVLKNEGGYVNNAADRGGETYRGISRKFWPKWVGWDIIDSTDHFDDRLDALVIEFYREYFWDALHLDKVEDDFVASMILDFGTNIGKKAIISKLQRVVGVKVDKIIGPITIRAINAMPRDTLVYHVLLEVVELYVQISNKEKRQRVFLQGWCNRAMKSYYEYERYRSKF